ncbi:hypothetical protein T12_15863 [Trichinella patagoniensis]|uniref:Uncharacterized protein n=1 Tax=Trichinella patagoniensis TaxID=990121 RepID=A0A0V0YW01_9BILA|nr:hypothetical protein T12_15863 [Trichinella patagoniensis]
MTIDVITNLCKDELTFTYLYRLRFTLYAIYFAMLPLTASMNPELK